MYYKTYNIFIKNINMFFCSLRIISSNAYLMLNLKIISHPRQKMLPSAAETPEKVIETPYENKWGK